jgi:hypothetical protein
VKARFSTLAGAMGLVILVLAGVFVVMLFVVPKFKPMGMTGVYVNNKFMSYKGDEVERIFTNRNIIVESASAEIFINASSDTSGAKGRVEVFENANGVAFNSLARTQIDFIETLDEWGGPYCKIVVQEPKGAVARTARVWINLKYDMSMDETEAPPYNFILNTGKSRVNFTYDESREYMGIKLLRVTGTGGVNFPAMQAGARAFKMDVETLDVESSNGQVKCPWPVGAVHVKGNSSLTLGVVDNLFVEDGGSNTIKAQEVRGAVDITSENCSFNCNKVLGNLDVTADRAAIGVQECGKLTVKAAGETATMTGSVSAGKINGDTKILMHSGSGSLGVNGTSGVRGNVDVENWYGSVNVNYGKDLPGPTSTKVRVKNGAVNVRGANGFVDIETNSKAEVNVFLSFYALVRQNGRDSRIAIYGSDEKGSGMANITVAVLDNECKVTFNIKDPRTIHDNINNPVREPKPDPNTNIASVAVNGGGLGFTLETHNTVTLQRGTYA